MILPDVLCPDLDIVFCGSAVGDQSALLKAYYAGPGNQFYPTLFACGLTGRQLLPHEFRELVQYRIGLTDLAKQVHGADSVLRPGDFDVAGLRQKILLYQPKIVCFNGKRAAAAYFGLRSTGKVAYGIQLPTIGRTRLFVAPSTSGAARGYWDIAVWRDLTQYV